MKNKILILITTALFISSCTMLSECRAKNELLNKRFTKCLEMQNQDCLDLKNYCIQKRTKSKIKCQKNYNECLKDKEKKCKQRRKDNNKNFNRRKK